MVFGFVDYCPRADRPKTSLRDFADRNTLMKNPRIVRVHR
jgi:hypothetical protein